MARKEIVALVLYNWGQQKPAKMVPDRVMGLRRAPANTEPARPPPLSLLGCSQYPVSKKVRSCGLACAAVVEAAACLGSDRALPPTRSDPGPSAPQLPIYGAQ